MLNLQSTDCQHIVGTSLYIDDVITNPTSYDRIEIVAKKNCCSGEYLHTIPLAGAGGTFSQKWTFEVAYPTPSSSLLLKSFTFKNISTGTLFIISAGSTPIDVVDKSDIEQFVDSVDTYFHVNTGSTLNTITGVVTGTTTYVTVVDGLPSNFIFVSADFITDDLDKEVQVTSLISDKVAFSSGIVFYPELLGLESFTDGVYNFTIKIFKLSGSSVTQSNCIFIDCQTKCVLASIISRKNIDPEERKELLMLHYGLYLGSNCGCECNTLCDLFDRFGQLMSNYDVPNNIYHSNNKVNCGCI